MPNPLMQVDIDWNNDGRYSSPHDDITSDALAVSVARGRDNPWGRASAGQMQLTVRNHDDKYSPTNAVSPLFRSLVPGRMARFHMRYPWDTFTDDNAPLASHSPDKPTDAGGWTEHSGSWRVDGPGDALSLSGTPAGSGTPSGIAYATLDFGTADAWVAVDFTRSAASDNAGLVLRADADGNYILIHTDGVTLYASKAASNRLDATLASGALPWTSGETKRITARLKGQEIWIIAEDRGPGTQRTLVMDFTSAYGQRNARHGVASDVMSAGAPKLPAWDNFGGDYPIFTGFVDRIKPNVRRGTAARTATIFCRDLMTQLNQAVLYADPISSRQTATAGNAINGILDRISWPAAHRRIQTGFMIAERICSAWGDNALALCYDVQEATHGFFYVDSDGWPTYEGWDHRFHKSHRASLIALANAFTSVEYSDGIENILNDAAVSVIPTVNSDYDDNVLLHDYATADYFMPGESRTYRLKYNDYYSINPFPLIAVTANTQSDGLGDDLSLSFSSSIVEASGEGVVIALAYNGAAPSAFVTRVTVTDALNGAIAVPEEVTQDALDPASQAAHGVRGIRFRSKMLRVPDAARLVAHSYVDRYKDPRPHLRLGLVNRDETWLNAILAYAISDRITVVENGMGINQDFFIEGIQINVDAQASGGRVVNAAWTAVGVGAQPDESLMYAANPVRNAGFEHWDNGAEPGVDPHETGSALQWRRNSPTESAVIRAPNAGSPAGWQPRGGNWAASYRANSQDLFYVYQDLSSALLPLVRGRKVNASAWLSYRPDRPGNTNLRVALRSSESARFDSHSPYKAVNADWEQLAIADHPVVSTDRILWLMVNQNDPPTGIYGEFSIDDAALSIAPENYA